jgi:TonB-linked SusC/RagA family outer membrane protein
LLPYWNYSKQKPQAMKRLLLVFTCLLSVLFAVAQTRSISGIVKDDKGDPVAAASVRAKGARSGTTTKGDGSFTLTIPQNAQTLVVSSVGFTELEIALTPALTYDITLQKSSGQELSEVVVTAQGISRDRRSLGYATQNLKTDQIANKGEPNLVNALQGKVAGVNITGASGSPGASSNINIRGITSFLGSNQPLFVVDGIPVSNDVDRAAGTSGGPIGSLGDAQPANRISDLNLSNIESVNILKGPAAAALYGSRASNGAIIITTKKGAGGRGRLDISLQSSYGIQKVSGLPDLQDEYGQGASMIHNPLSTQSWGPKFGTTPTLANGLIDPATGEPRPYALHKDNIRDFFRTGGLNENNLTINTGDNTQNATFNIGHLVQKGVIPNTKLVRTNVQFGGNTSVGKLKIGGSISYVNSNTDGVIGGNSAGGGTGFANLVNVPRSLDLQSYKNDYKNPNGTQKYQMAANGVENPYFTLNENGNKDNLSRFLGTATLNYEIAPWLNATYRLGADVYTNRRKMWFAPGSFAVGGGLILDNTFYRQELNSDLMLSAKKKDIFTEGLNATAMIGWGVNQRRFQNVASQGDALVIPGFLNNSNGTVFSNGTAEQTTLHRIVGYYAQVQLDWNNYLFLELTGRVDQSSTLPKNKNTYLYPAAAASFVFSDAFDITNDWFSYGKLRASAAQVGRDANPYSLQNVFVKTSLGNNVASINFPLSIAGSNLAGFTLNNVLANPDIKPEFTTSYELGLNLGFFKNRLSIDAAVFNTVSKDQIFNVAVPASTGYSARLMNVGKMTNKGFELSANGTPVNGRDFQWEISANFTTIRNKVVDIAPGVENFPIASGQSFSGTVASIAKGYAYGVIIGGKLPRTPDGQYIINRNTGTYAAAIGNSVVADPNPDWTGGITNTFRFKGISLNFLWDYTKGGDIYSFTVAFMRNNGLLKETGGDRTTPMIIPGVIEDPNNAGKYLPNNIQISPYQYWRAAGLQSDLSVFDATVLRLRELSLGYDLPASILEKTPLSLVRFTAYARNLWFYAPNYPMDPEVNTQGAGNLRGLDLQGAPNAKTMGVSLKVSFK